MPANNKFRVSGDGVFFTIQGEGVSMGRPACFLRLSVCNLKCSWCDTRYSWDTELPEFWKEKKEWSLAETKKKIIAAWKCADKQIQRRLVITGGEPLLQKEMLDKLIEQLSGWAIEIETNGTIVPTPLMLKRCQFNCSPKLKNSGNLRQARIKGDVLKNLNKVNAIFKFVVTGKNDLKEIEADFVKPFKLDTSKVIIMPQGKTPQEISDNALKVVEVVKIKGYRLLGRLHCEIWGTKRGV